MNDVDTVISDLFIWSIWKAVLLWIKWGISKFVLTIVFLPVVLIVMVIAGLIKIALPLLLIIGIVGLITEKR